MVGIENIASYICEKKENNFGKSFDNKVISSDFISKSIGIEMIAIKEEDEEVYDMCMKAYNNLLSKQPDINIADIECIALITRHSSYVIPHTSAILHKKIFGNILDKNSKVDKLHECATFDIHLGCSGYVYGINIMKSFMESNNYKAGLLFTCDPLSDIIDKNDKDTAMLFGDAATVTYFKENAKLDLEKTTYHTLGEYYEVITRKENEYLKMDGRIVFSYTLDFVPKIINKNLITNNKTKEDIDLFILHQPNRYMIESIAKRMKLDLSKVPIDIKNYGNTNSSSIPIILEKYISDNDKQTFLLSGFGDGLNISSIVINRNK